jgi:intermediate peptidase
MQVALTFLRDFEKSGIHLPGPLRARFVELSDSLIAVGRTFLSYASSGPPHTPRIEIPDADRLLAGMGSRFIESLPRGSLTKRSSRYVVPGSWEAQMITRFAREGEARQLVYMGNMRADPERVAVLDRMMIERAELAGVLGKRNWAEVALVDKMAKTPENVMGFLQSLANHHHPAAAGDIAALQRLKATSLTGNPISPDISTASLPPLYAWDRDFYAEKLALSLNASSLPPISPYFSTGTVLLGLSRLFTRLYGISFRPAPVSAGEVWHPSVRRLDVVDESEGLIGVIYCDLFSREGKPPTAAHYTVRCSRRVDDDDLRGDRLPEGWDAAYGPGLEEEGVRQRGRDGRYQLPIVVLTTDFGTAEPGRPALLSWTDVETLFHEMGHAIHCERSANGGPNAKRSVLTWRSDDRSNRIPQRLWNAVRHGLCRTPFHPDGTFRLVTLCPRPVCDTLFDRRSPPYSPDQCASIPPILPRGTGDPLPNNDGDA